MLLFALLFFSPFGIAMSWFYPEEPKVNIPIYTPPKPKPKPLACMDNNELLRKGLFYCPNPNELEQHGLRWRSGKYWQSQTESFVKRIDHFSGAQWGGPSGSVGRLSCFYEGMEENTFPVKLTLTVLAKRPELPLWEEDEGSKGTLYNCVSSGNSVCDCPFAITEH